MRSTCKKLVTDITRGRNLQEDLPSYMKLLARQYNHYAVVKGSMNYYVLKEIVSEHSREESDITKYFEILTELLQKHIIRRQVVDGDSLKVISALRAKVEAKMKNLTAYTDGYEIYEYVLNRLEGAVKGYADTVDTEQLSAKMYQYVFSNNDTVVVNSKLQLLLAQLPVRMTKNKFMDIVTNTLSIYKGSEMSAVDDFCDMLRAAVLIKKPDGFETEYPSLYRVYDALCNADYRAMTAETYDVLSADLSAAATFINQESSAYMLMQEVINDSFTLLLTDGISYEDNQTASGYKSALQILDACINSEDMELLPEQLAPQFLNIEGVQEEVYENVVILEAAFEDIKFGKEKQIMDMELDDTAAMLSKVSKLLSTSLFADLDEQQKEATDIADNAYIMKLRDEITEEFKTLFEGKNRRVVRSMMSKLLSGMPIFMNSQQEIKSYFDYVLQNCQDASELTACSRLVNELMEDE